MSFWRIVIFPYQNKYFWTVFTGTMRICVSLLMSADVCFMIIRLNYNLFCLKLWLYFHIRLNATMLQLGRSGASLGHCTNGPRSMPCQALLQLHVRLCCKWRARHIWAVELAFTPRLASVWNTHPARRVEGAASPCWQRCRFYCGGVNSSNAPHPPPASLLFLSPPPSQHTAHSISKP